MRLILLLPLLLSTCYTAPAYAKVFPGNWNGECLPITSKYFHQNPGHDIGDMRADVAKQQGFIPPNIPETAQDIITCLNVDQEKE